MSWVEELVKEYGSRNELEEFYARTVAPIENSEQWKTQRHYPFSEKIGYAAESTLVRNAEIRYDRGEIGFIEKNKKEFQTNAEFRIGHDPLWRYENPDANSSLEVRIGPDNQDAPVQGNLAYMRDESIWQESDQPDQMATGDRIRQKLAQRAENLEILADDIEQIEPRNPARYNGQILDFHMTGDMGNDRIMQTWNTLDHASRLMNNF